MASQSGTTVVIRERDIPVREDVRGVCEVLGLDPLFLACEGKLALFCPADDAERVLLAMEGHPFGKNAALIGTVAEVGGGRLILQTAIGGSRVVDLPVGELVPRIC
jgi:hydrogenase expression/formation protein HypE